VGFCLYCPYLSSNWVKFCITELFIMLESTCKFCCGNQLRETRHFSYRHKWNYIYVCTVKPYDILTVKNTLEKCVLCHWLHHWHSCSLNLWCQWSTVVDAGFYTETTECPFMSHDFGHLPQCQWCLHSSGMLCIVDW